MDAEVATRRLLALSGYVWEHARLMIWLEFFVFCLLTAIGAALFFERDWLLLTAIAVAMGFTQVMMRATMALRRHLRELDDELC